MRVLPPDEAGLHAALDVLERGGIVAHATETCYGLACDIANPDAVALLFSVKRRPLDQPVSALFPSIAEAKRYVEWPAQAEALAKNLPGPLTLILHLRTDSPHPLFPTPNGGATIGVRVSSHPVAQALVERFGRPLTTTSANIHGNPSPYSEEEILEQYSAREPSPDLLLSSGTLPHILPSTVVNIAGEKAAILRHGPLKLR
ncbi:MAG: L-threonylcarbamoyladenylate synthase [Candidatus Peregrinibacteria bacterium]|nr:L-threonylcarbamoyladenylate synthase [Candidatus Peregrinibacteria bacterium]